MIGYSAAVLSVGLGQDEGAIEQMSHLGEVFCLMILEMLSVVAGEMLERFFWKLAGVWKIWKDYTPKYVLEDFFSHLG